MSERWIAILWDSELTTPSGAVYDFSANWDAWTSSIMEYARIFKAPVLGRLPHLDVEHDEARAPVWGSVSEMRVLTRDEASAKGIDQLAERVLYAKADVWDGERILYVSPNLRWNFLADDGVVWPCVISHVAVVGEPLQQTMQRPQTTLESLAMSREAAVADVPTEKIDDVEEIAGDVSDQADEAVSIVEELAAKIAELEAKVAELTGGGVETEEVDLDMSRNRSTGSLEKLMTRIVRKEISAERRARDASEISRVCKQLNMSRAAAEAAHAAMSSEEWARFSGSVPKVAASDGKPSSLGMSRARNLSGSELDTLATAYQRKHGVSYSEALRKVGGMD